MFAEHLSAFLDANEMATQAVLDNVEVAGIFDNGYREALGSIGVQDPTYTLPSASCAAARPGSHLRIPGEASYQVTAIEPDGTGLAVLRLALLP